MVRIVTFFVVWLSFSLYAAAQQNVTIQVQLGGQRVEGTPLAWSSSRVHLLLRDGRIWDFSPTDAKGFQQVSSSFRSYTQSDMRGQLLTEFGRRFEVSGTGQFLVVHPVGLRDKWARRFEELYRSFRHYFTVRGLRPQTPPFPFVAVVFHDQVEFLKYSASQGVNVDRGVLGYYSPKTNRVLIYDQDVGSGGDNQWQKNGAIIIHEASHQSAFNTGIHNRFAPPPRWVAEGLGTMFEARGVWDSRNHASQSDRINRGWFENFTRHQVTNRRKGSLAELISSDRTFQTNPTAAYAQSWALTFYLAEREPQKYFQYLAKTGQREAFTPYRSTERLADFTSVFGSNLDMLDTRLVRFMQQLK